MDESSSYYDKIAPSYGSLYGEEQLEKWNECKELIKISGLVLDAGCGNGILTSNIKNVIVKNVIGVDSSIKLLEQCRELSVILADITNLPFKDKCFDTIVSFTVLQDIPDTSKAVFELKRVLKPGGRILITVLNKSRVSAIRSELKKEFGNLNEKIVGNDVAFYN